MIDQDLQAKTRQWLKFVASASALNLGCDDESDDSPACGVTPCAGAPSNVDAHVTGGTAVSRHS